LRRPIAALHGQAQGPVPTEVFVNQKKTGYILSGLLLGILCLRFFGIQALNVSLGRDAVYLQTVNIFSKMESVPLPPVFNSKGEISLPLDAHYSYPQRPQRLWEGSFFNLFSGNVVLTETDFEVYPRGSVGSAGDSSVGSKNPLSFTRFYNSKASSLRSPLGFGWSPFWDIRTWLVEDVYVFRWPSGELLSFKYDTQKNRYFPLVGAWMGFSMASHDNLLILKAPNQVFEFAIVEKGPRRQLSKIIHGTGFSYALKWDSEGHRVESVIEESTGRKTEYIYNNNSNTALLSTIIFPSGKKIQYAYDTHQNLSKITNDTKTFQRMYAYDNPSFQHQMTGLGNDKIQHTLHFSRQKLERIEVPGFGAVTITRDALLGLCEVRWMNGAGWTFQNTGENVWLVEGPLDFKEKVTWDDKGLPIKITDAQNGMIQNVWNDQQQLMQREDPTQAIESFDYDPSHHLVEHTDRLGNTTQFQYEKGLLKYTLTPNNDVFRYSYYENLVESIVHENDKNQCRFHYDKSGLLSMFENEKGLHTRYKYNLDGYLIEKTSPKGWAEIYRWNGNQLMEVSYLEQDGTQKKQCAFDYAPSGLLMSKTVSPNQKIQFQYDLLGHITEISDPGEPRKQFSWNGEGLLETAETNGQAFQYTYDLLGRLIKITKNEKASWKFQYEKNAGIPIAPFHSCFSTLEDPQGLITQLSYDKNYQVSKAHLPNGRVQSFEYNAEGLLTTQDCPSQGEISYTYDKHKHLESIYRHAENRVTFYTHDWRGHLISGTDALHQTFFIGYDPFGNPISIQKGIEDPFSEWEWDEDRFLKKISTPTADGTMRFEKEIDTHGLGLRTSLFDTQQGFKELRYTTAGKIQSSVDGMGYLVENTYYDNHKLKSKILRNSDVEYLYSYDLSNRLRRMTGVAPCEYTWSDEGQLLKLTFDKKNILLMAYTENGKLVKKTYPGFLVQQNKWNIKKEGGEFLENISENSLDPIQYTYDSQGRKTQILFPNKIKTQIEYDTLGRIRSMLSTNTTGETLFKRLYQYDAQNRVSQISTERGEISAMRDPHGRVISQTWDDKAGTQFAYTFNNKGQIDIVRKKNEQGETVLQWIFDARGLLQKILQKEPVRPSKNIKNIVTNLVGTVLFDSGFLEVNKEVIQMNNKKFQVNNVLLNPGSNTIPLRYINASGRENRQQIILHYDPEALTSFLYDLNGKMTFQSQEGLNIGYQYNDEGFLEMVHSMVGNKRKTIKYQYYGNTLLCFRHSETEGEASKTVKFIFDGQDNLIGEFLDQDNSFDSLYMFSPEGSLVYRIDRGHKKFYYHLDKDGSVIGITNHLGQIVCTYSYDFLGHSIEKKETLPNPFLYLGHYYDANADRYFHKGFVGTPKEHFHFFNPTDSEGTAREEPEIIFSRVFPTYTQAFPKNPDPFDWAPALETTVASPFIPTIEFLSQPETWACRPSQASNDWSAILNMKTRLQEKSSKN
jgi:YD repeat-containing protein